jgi:hypothetical protein
VHAGIRLLIVAAVAAPFRTAGCASACDEALDLCRDCDVAVSTCVQRFRDAPEDVCERAVDEYIASGCTKADRGDCSGDPQPDPRP